MENVKKKPKVIVAGAGIGGLTVAHELSKRGFKVVVYERNSIAGGLARSTYYEDPAGQSYPVEYSWRVYGTGYKNLLRLLRDIPLRESEKKSVFEHLVKVSTYIFPRFDRQEAIVSPQGQTGSLTEHFEPGDKFSILDKIFFCLTISKARMNSLDHLTWKEYCRDISPESQKFMVRMWGPVLGMDPTFMSFPVIARMTKILLAGFLPVSGGSLYVMNQPTNDAWFDEWTEYLQQTNGVIIQYDSEVRDLELENNRVQKIVVHNKKTNQTFENEADYFICGLSVETIAAITQKNPALSAIPSLQRTIALARIGRQIQLSVQIFLDKKLVYPTKEKNVLYLPDTPWALIIEPEDLIWDQTYCSDERVKTVLSVGICQTDVPGILHQKSFVECTEAEIQEEVWAQIVRSYNVSGIKTEDGGSIVLANIVLFYIWDSYKFDSSTKRIEVWEPKFSNNAGGFVNQPTPTTELDNFFFATAYTQTDRFIYSMEAAAEAGTVVANEILKREGESPTTVYPFQPSSIILAPLIFIDRILFALGLPHLSKLLRNSVILVVVYFAAALVVVWMTSAWLLARLF